jgi:hypothetical protein
MSDCKVMIIGGQKCFKLLSNRLTEKQYAACKVNAWFKMITKAEWPTKWLKPNKDGTRVNFKAMNGEDDYNKALDEIKSYISEINEKYGFDYKISFKEMEDAK